MECSQNDYPINTKRNVTIIPVSKEKKMLSTKKNSDIKKNDNYNYKNNDIKSNDYDHNNYNSNTSSANDLQNNLLKHFKYLYPREDVIPPDYYYSEIVDIQNTVTSKGRKAKNVFYKIARFWDMYRKVNGLLKEGEKIKTFKIKQTYPIDSDYYLYFLNSMCTALKITENEYCDDYENDFIGISEYISIGYDNTSNIGGIQLRKPWYEDDFIALYEEKNAPLEYLPEYLDVEVDEYGNLI